MLTVPLMKMFLSIPKESVWGGIADEAELRVQKRTLFVGGHKDAKGGGGAVGEPYSSKDLIKAIKR